MKTKTKRNYLLGIILSTFLIVGIINVTNGEKTFIDTNPDISKLHTSSLFSLFLGNNSNNVEISVDTGGDNLNIRNGLIIGKNHTVTGSPKLSVIGGGKNNTMSGNYAGIGGGNENIINYDNGVIGGGRNNEIKGQHGIIGGGYSNKAYNYGIVLGGQSNTSYVSGIILGGKNNKSTANSLVLGSNAEGDNYSFARNGKATNFSARINTTGGMLIGTYNPITGVSLVVSGATKLSGDNNSHNAGGIFVNSTGCIQFYDGNVYNTLGKASENSEKCGINTGCQFGTTILHHGDIQTAYSASYAKDCQTVSGNVTCTNGKMVDSNGNSNKYIYPYCYNLSSDPIIDVESGYQNCTGLPENAKWVNPYFDRTSNGNTYKPAAHFDDQGLGDACSYECMSGFSHENGKCVQAGCSGGQTPADNDIIIKSQETPSENKERQYVENVAPSQLQACQWTCPEDYTNNGNNDCTLKNTSDVAYLITGPEINNMMGDLTNLSNIQYFKMYAGNSIPSSAKIISTDEGKEVKMWYDNGTMYYYTDASIIYLNENSKSIFEGLNNVKTIDTSKWDTSNVIDMAVMFSDCRSLTEVDVSNWNTSNVKYMYGMFSATRSLNSLNIENRKTSNVTNMENMFKQNYSLTELDLSNWDTSNVTNMSYMFESCTGLLELNVSNWNTSSGTNMMFMFRGCAKLTELDLSNWDTSNVTNMSYMFYNCFNLTTINTSNKFKVDQVTNSYNMFLNATQLEGQNGTQYDESHIDKEYARLDCGTSAPGYFSSKTQYSCNNGEPTLDAAYLITGTDINNMMGDLTNLSNIQYFKMYAGNSIPSGVTTKIISTDEGKEVKMWYDNNKTIYYYTDASTIYMHSDSSRMFENLSNLKSLDFSQGNWNTSRVTNMEKMFWVCSNLQTIKFGSGWDTSKVGNMIQMFAQCESLKSLDFSKGNWDTSNVTDMTQMFANCSNLQTINFGNKWNTSKVTDMTLMFGVCQSLTSLDFSQGNWNTSNVTGMDSMFYSCQELTSLDFSKGNWNTSNVTSMEKMFESCYKLETINFGNKWDTSKVTDMTQMFANGYKLTTLDFSQGNWNTSKVKKMTSMFNGMGNLTTIYVSDNFKVDQVTNSSLMFYNDKKLKGQNGTQYNGSHMDKEYARIDCPNNPGYFSSHSNLCNNSTPDVAYLITGPEINNMMKNLTDVSNIKYFKMYAGNSIPSTAEIISTDEGKEVKMWYDNNKTIYYYTDASKIYLNKDSSHMFDDLENVETIETLKWDTTRVVNMSYMFYNCKNLKNLDVQVSHGWYTDNVKDMSFMFRNCKNLTNLELSDWKTDEVESMKDMFNGCSSLTSLDLSNWNTRDVLGNGMESMFFGCSNLQSIKFGENWNMVGYQSSVKSISSMFYGCSSLTSLDLSSWNTSEVLDMSSLFYGCTNLKNITFGDNRFTNKVKYMNHMFDGCSSLTNLDLSSWNTSQVQEMKYTFSGCSSLTNLDLSSWNTSQVTNITSMFENANNLKKIYASENFKVDHITGSSYSWNMFKNASSIIGGQGTTYDSSNIHKQYARLDCGLSNPGYFSKKDDDYSSCQ